MWGIADMHEVFWLLLQQCSICKSDDLTTVLNQCNSYLPGQTSIFYNQTNPPNSAAIPSLFAAIHKAAQNMSGCADIAKELLCFSMFPFCDPTSSEPHPLPICSQTCNAFTQGQCGALFNNSHLLTLVTSNCGQSTPVAGDPPECIMSSRLSGTLCTESSCGVWLLYVTVNCSPFKVLQKQQEVACQEMGEATEVLSV